MGRDYSRAVPPSTPFSVEEPTRFPNGSRTKRPAFVDYWERTVPWTFKQEKLPYSERRHLRYSLQDYMEEAIPFGLFDGKRVLEIGSGSGIDLAEFGKNGAQVIGLDFTETGTKSTRDTLAEAGVSSSDVVRAAAQHLPFRDGVFDCVYSFGVLHHIPDVDVIVQDVASKLVENGELVLMLYNRDSLLYSYSILFLHGADGLSEEGMLSRYSERIEGCPYTKAYTVEDARQLLAYHFRDITTSIYFDVIDMPERRKVKFQLGGNHRLGWHMIVRARKRTTA